jgi:3-oxoadipate enol-lactonase
MQMNGMEVEVAGEGPPLVLVHGLGGTGNVWQPHMAALSRRFKVYRPDLRGSGRSSLPASVSVASLVADLMAILEHEHIERASFAGHSFGALVLQHLAALHPTRVAKLVLVGPVKAPADAGRKGARDRAATVRAEGMVAVADTIAGFATSPTTRESKPAVMALVREFLMRQNVEGYARTCEALAAAEDPDLSHIACPTLIIAGADDAVAPLAVANRLQGEIAASVVEVIEQCGHWTSIEQPERVTAALDRFL